MSPIPNFEIMLPTLSSISEPTITAIVVALITLISTLSGVIITNKSNHKKLLLEIKHRENQEKRKTIQEKAEELFMVIEDLDEINQYHYTALKTAVAMNVPADFISKVIMEKSDKLGELQKRLRMLLHLYFSDFEDSLIKLSFTKSPA